MLWVTTRCLWAKAGFARNHFRWVVIDSDYNEEETVAMLQDKPTEQ